MGNLLKKYLITGLLVWLPIVVTIWVITYIIGATDKLINLIPEQWRLENQLGLQIPGQGFVIAIVILFITGVLTANVLGRKKNGRGEITSLLSKSGFSFCFAKNK